MSIAFDDFLFVKISGAEYNGVPTRDYSPLRPYKLIAVSASSSSVAESVPDVLELT